jgi:hypothetical protein
MPSNIALPESIKDGSLVQTMPADDVEDVHKGHVPIKYMGTVADQRDMSTLGRQQVLRVRNRSQWLRFLEFDVELTTK